MTTDRWPVQARIFALTLQREAGNSLRWIISPTVQGLNKNGHADFGKVRREAANVRRAIVALNRAIEPRGRFSRRYRSDCRARLEAAGDALSSALFGTRSHEVACQLPDSGFALVRVALHEEDLPIEFCRLPDPTEVGRRFYFGERALVVRDPPEEREDDLSSDEGDDPVQSSHLASGIDSLLDLHRSSRLVGYAESEGLESACRIACCPSRPSVEEVYALSPIGPIEDIHFLDPYLGGPRPDFEAKLGRWLAVRREIVHFNSHSDLLGEGEERVLDVRRKFPVGRDTFARPARGGIISAYSGTIFFLNACSSAFANATLTRSICGALLAADAPVVACTLGPVDDVVATTFAREFYKRLAVPGTTVAHAIQSTKQELLVTLGHPLALLYTAMGNVEFAL